MTEHEQSPWAPRHTDTHHVVDKPEYNDPDNVDNMKMVGRFGSQNEVNNEMITMPDWTSSDTSEQSIPVFETASDEDRFAEGKGVVVRRSDGTIESGWKTTTDENDQGIVVEREDNGRIIQKRVTREVLTELLDAYELKVTKDLGEAGVQSLMEQPEEPDEQDEHILPHGVLKRDASGEMRYYPKNPVKVTMPTPQPRIEHPTEPYIATDMEKARPIEEIRAILEQRDAEQK